ncbi:MAG: 4-alpha-glucanotransferase [Gammaproteobacteria bacterium]|nr:MAG: 4-alpha-glucanotransferase [Gammaproteobacteria bacterium]
MHRSSGILLHPTSLPGPFGIGDIGPAARQFIDRLADAGQGLWQILPTGPTGYRDSPYQCTSALAGNPLLISPELLLEAGWLDAADLALPAFPDERVDFGQASHWKRQLLERACLHFRERAAAPAREAFDRFCAEHRAWLDDYATFSALRAAHEFRPWTEWPEALALRDDAALSAWLGEHAHEVDRERFIQFVFYTQWQQLRDHAAQRGIRLIGDMPIFLAHDSSEVWTHREWFHLDPHGEPTVVAGVPPDYFSATGQRWGNPLYDWERLAADNYALWVNRMQGALELVDLIRIDHFRGFAACWEIPASEPTALHGRWVQGPGMHFFDALKESIGENLHLIAEDLGLITEDVEALRDALGVPGMAVLQFAFEDIEDGYGRSHYLPHHHRRTLCTYTGTHDNDTVRGWWNERRESERAPVRRYLRAGDEDIHWGFIRANLGSVADLAVIPLQDLLGLGSEARMNTPGTEEGNWSWRVSESQLAAADWNRLRELSRLYGRSAAV